LGMLLAACGSDPTATPRPTDTPAPTPTPTATLVPGAPTPTPAPTPTSAPPTPTPARDMDAYFSGKIIRIQVGFSPGGGYDTYSRLIAKFLPVHVPGNPRAAVVNLPGTGGLRGLLTTMASDPDGLTIGTINPRWVVSELIGDDVEGFDLAELTPLGSPSALRQTRALYVLREVATSWAEVLALGRPLIMGEVAPGSQSATGISWGIELGAPLTPVFGYGGSSEVMAAMDRGEIEAGTYGSPELVNSLYPEWTDSPSHIVPIVRWGVDPEEDPAFVEWMATLGAPMPPHVTEIVDFTPEQLAVLDTAEAVNSAMSRFAALPPGVPEDILAVLKKAYADTIADPDFIAAAELLGRDVVFASPEAINEAIEVGRKLAEDPVNRALFKAIASAN